MDNIQTRLADAIATRNEYYRIDDLVMADVWSKEVIRLVKRIQENYLR